MASVTAPTLFIDSRHFHSYYLSSVGGRGFGEGELLVL